MGSPFTCEAMKLPLIIVTVLSVLASAAHGGDSKMSRQQVVEFAKRIAADKRHEAVGGYELESPEFNKKEGVWKFRHKVGPAGFPEAPIPIFEIRDADAFFRVGYLTYSGANVPKFKLASKFRKQLKEIR
jgi:hypothetical protein